MLGEQLVVLGQYLIKALSLIHSGHYKQNC